MSDKDLTGKCDLLRRVTDEEGFKALLVSRTDTEVTGQQDYSNRNCLILATRKNSVKVVAMLLERFGKRAEFVNHKDIVGGTALTYAAEFGLVDILKLLFESGRADPAATDHFGNTPIIWAAKRGHLHSLKALACFVKSLDVWKIKGEDNLDAGGWAGKKGHVKAKKMIDKIVNQLSDGASELISQLDGSGGGDGCSSIGLLSETCIYTADAEVETTSSEKDRQPELLACPNATWRPKTPLVDESMSIRDQQDPDIGRLGEFNLASNANSSRRSVVLEDPLENPSNDLDRAGRKKALVAFNLVSDDSVNVPYRQQALEVSMQNLNLTFRRCDFDVADNGRPTPENLRGDLDQMIAGSGIDDASTTAAAFGLLEFNQFERQQRKDLLSDLSQRPTLISKPKWIVDLGIALPEESLHGGCVYEFSNSEGDTDTDGTYLTRAMRETFSKPNALLAGLDTLMESVVDTASRASDGRAKPQHRSFLRYSNALLE